MEEVEAILRARFSLAAATSNHVVPEEKDANERRKEISLPDRGFIVICLRVWQYRVEDAARVAGNFAAFRSVHGWPYQLSAVALERELRSEVHWLLEGSDR